MTCVCATRQSGHNVPYRHTPRRTQILHQSPLKQKHSAVQSVAAISPYNRKIPRVNRLGAAAYTVTYLSFPQYFQTLRTCHKIHLLGHGNFAIYLNCINH